MRASNSDDARRVAARAMLVLGWIPLALLIPVGLLPSLPETYRYLPLVASGLLFGMPHGAVDYVAFPRARRGEVTVRGIGVAVALYAVVGGAYLLAWVVAPVAAAVGFILLTWFHWGQGEVYALRGLFGVDHLEDATGQALTVVVRGGLPMLVPLLAFPGRYRAVVDSFVGPFGGGVGQWALFEPGARAILGGGFALVTVLTLTRGRLRATDRRGWRIDAAEVGLLWVFFLAVPPILAVGAYFTVWHSVRHIARVVVLDSEAADAFANRQWLPAIRQFAVEAAIPTVLALLGVAVLWVALDLSSTTVASATGVYLVGIAVLTLPHTVVVTVLDREQGLWTPPTLPRGIRKGLTEWER